jgi:hypothetical protein
MILDTEFCEEKTIVEDNHDATTLTDCVYCACTCSCSCTCPAGTCDSKANTNRDGDKAKNPYSTSANAKVT